MTEEDTKLKYITPSILKEWNINNIKMEYKTPNNKFVDYALFIDNKLITIIEAKSYNYDDEFGLQQAIEYAKELNICFVYSSSGHKFIEYNLITKEKRILSLSTFPSPIDLSLMCDIYSNMQFSNLLFDNLPISNNSINYNEYINFIKNLDKEIDFYTKNSYNLRKNIKLQKTKIFNQIKYDKYNYENNLNLIQNKIKYLNIFFNNFIKLYFLNKNMIQFYKETYDSFFLFNNSTTYSFLNYKYHLCQSLLLKNNKIMDEIKDDLIYIGSHFQIILNELIFIFNKTKNKFDKDEYYNIFNFNFQTINIDFDFIKNNLNETYLYFKKSIKKVQTIKNNYKTSKINYDEILILCKNIIFNINIKSLEYDITKNNLINLINSIRKTILDILIHYINNIIIDIIYKIEIENNKRKIKILKPKYSIDYVFNILEINNKIITNRNPLILSSSKLLYPK